MSSEPFTKSDLDDILAYEANNLPVNPKPQVALVGLRVDRRFKSPCNQKKNQTNTWSFSGGKPGHSKTDF